MEENAQNGIQKEQAEYPVQPPAEEKPKKAKWIWWLVGCGGCGCLLVILAIIAAIAIPSMLNARRAAWEAGAKGTLRSLESAQRAYQQDQTEGNFGTFEDLQDEYFVAEGYDLENMIDNYRLTWDVYNSPGEENGKAETSGVHSFTIVAYPLDTRAGYLLTFGVREDGVIRVYNPYQPGSKQSERDVLTWDPIMVKIQ